MRFYLNYYKISNLYVCVCTFNGVKSSKTIIFKQHFMLVLNALL